MQTEVIQTIKRDIEANKDIKNKHLFFLYRYGHYIHGKRRDSLFYKLVDYLIRFIYKLTINNQNHIPLETKIGGV